MELYNYEMQTMKLFRLFIVNPLARECAKLDPEFEKAIAEEGLSVELNEWPEY